MIWFRSDPSPDWYKTIECRANCGACCIAPSITSPIPGMPEGKPAGVRCIHLNTDYACDLFGDDSRPKTCADLLPEPVMCGESRTHALNYLVNLDELTR